MLPRGYLAIVYVSSSKESVLGPLLNLSRSLKETYGTVFAHSFHDDCYNRTSFFLVDKNGANLANSAAQLYESAIRSLNFLDHDGSHPTLGVCDHVTFCPLCSENSDDESLISNIVKSKDESVILTSSVAMDFIKRISPISSVFRYGAVSRTNVELATIRRRLGYFQQVKNEDKCIYDPEDLKTRVRECVANLGDDEKSFSFHGESLHEMNSRTGVTCVGAIPYIMNFNITFDRNADVRLVKRITKAVRELDGVEALTLKQDGAHEVACNLKKPNTMGPDGVLRVCDELAKEFSISITKSYTTGPTERDLIDILESTRE